ncbi:hypothetical protein [Bacillus sp. Marseille-Q1617]|uniref:hypothetical protein n=1 Tax=Bacillus sp. Marseille-Q1617 TaxID=2736887 RepID=UPI001589515A|nr:hypothetical protein [Bacillus sp. Marseille-Q1617]
MNFKRNMYGMNFNQSPGFSTIDPSYQGAYAQYGPVGGQPGYGYWFPGYPPPVQGPGPGYGYGYGYGLNPLGAGLIGLGLGFLGGQIVGGPYNKFGKRYFYYY